MELQRLWPRALESDDVRVAPRADRPPGRRVLRLFGVSESAVARALAEAGGDGDGVEVTICARDFEIHVDLVVEPGAEARADELEAAFLPPIEQWLYSRDERGRSRRTCSTLCRERGLTLGTAESCTGGLVAARLTSVSRARATSSAAASSPTGTRSRSAELGVPAALHRRARRRLGRGRRGDGAGRPRRGSASTSRCP